MMCQKIKSLFEYEKLHTNDELYEILDVDEDASEEEIEITFDELFGILGNSQIIIYLPPVLHIDLLIE